MDAAIAALFWVYPKKRLAGCHFSRGTVDFQECVWFASGMTRSEAEKLSLLFLKIGADLNQSVAFVRDHDSEEAFHAYRKVAGQLMGDLYVDAMEPLWKRFPELRPVTLGGSYEVTDKVYEPLFYEYLK